MPPKSAVAAAPRGRGVRFTARKRIPNYSNTIRARTRSSATATADSGSAADDNLIPSTDIPASSGCPQDAGVVRASGATDALGMTTPHAATPVRQAESEGFQKTLAADLGFGKAQTGRGNRDEELENSVEAEKSVVEPLGSGNITHVEDVTNSGVEDGSRNSVDLSSVAQVEEKSSVQALTAPGSGVGEVAGTGIGKRKVVRKVVRLVKKVIKKRVPKRILKSGSNDQGLMDRAQDELNLSDGIQSSNLGNEVIEKSNDMDEMTRNVGEGKEKLNVAVENLNFVNDGNVVEKSNEVIVKENITGEVTQELKLVGSTSGLELIVGEKGHHPSGIDWMGAETLGFQFGANFPGKMVDQRFNDQSGNHTGDAAIRGNEVKTSIQAGKVDYNAKTVMTAEEIENSSMENQSKVSIAETSSMNIIDKDDERLIACQNVDLEEETDEVLVVEKNKRKIEKPDNGNGEMESDSSRLSELSLSGEMEALERRKKRKTEIFLGGLDKDTNEDDIRKVLNEVGEVLEVRLVMNGQTGKNKGFAFVRFASAADAKNALENYSTVVIRAKQCGIVPIEGNDTIFLGNIDKSWKAEDVVRVLEKAGIEKIDKVTLKVDPKNIEKNRGFAFVEFETCRDAQNALNKLQKKDAFGRNPKVKVEWAQPIDEPEEEEILKVKSVYAEFLPSSWDEEKVRAYFKRFGEIENVVLAKNLPSSRRKDFAFIDYTTRDAAMACIEAINREKLEGGHTKVKIAVSLAKPSAKGKQMKHTSEPSSKQLSKAKPKGSQTSKTRHEPRQKGKHAKSSHHNVQVDEPATTDELVQILRQQASSNQIPPYPRTGPSIPDYEYPLPGSKRPFSLMAQGPLYVGPGVPQQAHDLLYAEPRVTQQARDPLYVEPRVPQQARDPLYMETRIPQQVRDPLYMEARLPHRARDPLYMEARLPQQVHDPRYVEPRVPQRGHMENSYPISGPSVDWSSFPIRQERPSFTPESVNARRFYPVDFQTTEPVPYYGNSNKYQRY